MKNRNPEVILEKYYRKTAHTYDEAPSLEEGHNVALRIIAGFASVLSAKNILDVGTGRGVKSLAELLPRTKIVGVDLSVDLLQEGIRKASLPAQRVCVAHATRLPFRDDAFDLSIETATLHHTPNPAAAVRELLRVSKLGIAISDSNMYVDGTSLGVLPKGLIGNTVKMLLCKTGVWKKLKVLCSGKEWNYSDGNGVFWTYSAYKPLSLIKKHCAHVFTIPLKGKRLIHELPLLGASHVLVIGMKNSAVK